MTGNELAVVARLARCGLRPVEQVEGCASHRLGNPRCRFELETPESSGDAMVAASVTHIDACGRPGELSGIPATVRSAVDTKRCRWNPMGPPRFRDGTGLSTRRSA
jgi:hypothetical protein